MKRDSDTVDHGRRWQGRKRRGGRLRGRDKQRLVEATKLDELEQLLDVTRKQQKNQGVRAAETHLTTQCTPSKFSESKCGETTLWVVV